MTKQKDASPNAEVSERLREARLDRGFKSASAFARTVKVDPQVYINQENGSRGLKLPVMKKYCRALKINLAWLADGIGPRDVGAALAEEGRPYEYPPGIGVDAEDVVPETPDDPWEEVYEAQRRIGRIVRGLSPEAKVRIDLLQTLRIMQEAAGQKAGAVTKADEKKTKAG